MAPSTFVKVNGIRPDSVFVDLVVKVVSCDARLHCLSGAGLQMADATVGDETGTVMLRLSGQHARLCDPGATLVVRGARVEIFEGQIRLELGRWSRLTPLAMPAAFVPNTGNDISGVEHALVVC
eukprot:TRINITY_DN70293_c0_g1_i1.p2 TRINITY_DN70293_c0_g1~~TRINITY_DN70293_c0_g1_i1.p2  ORF type:complete len:135 (+),score=30.19 TRINITY_DN70293_c0_g1_i1:35-406(+)